MNEKISAQDPNKNLTIIITAGPNPQAQQISKQTGINAT